LWTRDKEFKLIYKLGRRLLKLINLDIKVITKEGIKLDYSEHSDAIKKEQGAKGRKQSISFDEMQRKYFPQK
jgi:hypothetical protein